MSFRFFVIISEKNLDFLKKFSFFHPAARFAQNRQKRYTQQRLDIEVRIHFHH